jgi:integrase
LEETPEWHELDSATHAKNIRMIECFLEMHVDAESKLTWRNTPVEFMTTKHLKDLLAPFRKATPTKAKHLLVAIRKVIGAALDQDGWLAVDPSFGIKVSIPPTDGHKEWPEEIQEKYKARHPLGTAARTAFELARWLGNRCGDIADVHWDHLVEEELERPDGEFASVLAFSFRQQKNRKRTGGKEMFLPVRPQLAEALRALPAAAGGGANSGHILLNAYGRPFSKKSLTGMMAHWTKQAGIEPGYTLHGLRKSFGIWLAENGASARQIQDAMGHSSMTESDRYIRKANRKRLVSDAFFAADEKEQRRAAGRARARLRLVG